MIKDVLLVSALILSIVLIYRMYVVNQKINNLSPNSSSSSSLLLVRINNLTITKKEKDNNLKLYY
jgi:hypothetical protein